MIVRLMDHYSDEEIAKIIAESNSYAECLQKIGYSANSGYLTQELRNKVKELKLDVSHFDMRKPGIQRTDENTFCIDSTVNRSVLRRHYIKKYPMIECAICGQKPFWNGKPMTLILDHINGTNNDNRIENLRWVCPNCNIQLDTTNARNPHYKKYYCSQCGKPVSGKDVVLCLECDRATQSKQTRKVENRPSREELKKLIRSLPFLQIGKMFDVSDNTIRKWCDAVQLPRTKRDIETYSDEEWENI